MWCTALQRRAATIIPLGRTSRCGSSDLPEGSRFSLACAILNGARLFAETLTQRAGPALPSYLVLHHAGFAMPAPLLAPRWALTPPFHPYLRANHEDIPKVFLRAITGYRTAGGIFSVALSVNRCGAVRRGGRSLPQLPWRYRRVALHPEALRPKGYFFTCVKWCPDFPPAQPLAQTRPAIIQLTRQSNYIAILANQTASSGLGSGTSETLCLSSLIGQ